MNPVAAARQVLPRTVIVLGCVSLANDAASEMITPLLPLFLTATLGAGPAVVGLVEGLAEATASILKVVSGRLVDRGVGAKRLVLAGYGASNAARPLIGLALGWGWVLLLRFMDRVGKGIRTAPRDAMIAGAVGTGARGRAFGFHRAMDHGGAVLGPLLAFALLGAGATIPQVFLWSAVPGLVVLALAGYGLPADPEIAPVEPPRISLAALDARLKAMMVSAGLLALSAVPEVFIVLWATSAGMPVAWIPLAWALASVVKMTVVLPAGWLADHLGPVRVLLFGWSARVALLLLLAAMEAQGVWVWILFVAYAATLAVTEAPERALVGDSAPAALRGTAFGVYHLATGLFVLPGALLLGTLWEKYGSAVAFRTAAAITAIAAIAMLLSVRRTAVTAPE